MLDEDERSSSTVAFVAGVDLPGFAMGTRFGIAGSPMDQLLRVRRSTVIDGDEMRRLAATNEDSIAAIAVGLQSLLLVPLMWQDRLVGALHFRSRQHSPFTPEVVALAEQVSGQIAGGIATARLYARAKQDALAQAVMADIGRIVSSSLNMEEVYPKFAEQAAKLVPFDRLVIMLLEDDQRSDVTITALVSGMHLPGFTVGRRVGLTGHPAEKIVRAGRSTVIDGDEMRRLAATNEDSIAAIAVGLQSLLLVPLMWQDRLVGALHFRSKLFNPYTPEVVALAEQVAAQIAGAVASAGLYAHAKRDVLTRTVIAEIGRAANSDLAMPRMCQSLAAVLGRIFQYDRLVIAQAVGDGMLRVLHIAGVRVADADPGMVLFPVGVRDILPAREDGCILIGSTTMQKEPSHIYHLAGLRSWMQAPVGPAEKPLAYISLRSRQEDAYSERELELLKEVASQVAPAIRNAETMEALDRDVAQRTADLSAAIAARTRVLATMSRELSSGLSVATAFSETLQKNSVGSPTEKQSIVLRSLTASAAHIQELVNDLTDFKKVEGGQIRLSKVSVDLSGMVNDVADSSVQAVRARGQSLVVSGCDHPVRVWADWARMAQVLSNLISTCLEILPLKHHDNGVPRSIRRGRPHHRERPGGWHFGGGSEDAVPALLPRR